MNVLHICGNPKPTDEAVSKQLAAAFFIKLAGINPDVEVINVDLHQEPPPHYTYEEYRNFWYPATIEGYVPTKEETAAADYAYKQAQLFNSADVLVLTMPMWNYSMPAMMKSWIDHVLAPGLTYDFEHKTITPRHKIQRLIMLISSGQAFKEDDPRDALTPAITAAFGDIGIKDVASAWADGQNTLVYTDYGERKSWAMEAAEELAEEVAELAPVG